MNTTDCSSDTVTYLYHLPMRKEYENVAKVKTTSCTVHTKKCVVHCRD
ncbi:hypothetical protein [Lapidilactobacillus salsurivasis]